MSGSECDRVGRWLARGSDCDGATGGDQTQECAANSIPLRAVASVMILALSFGALSCGGCWMLFGRSERLATFAVGPYTIDVFAEPEFHYEPPGYVYFELQKWGETLIPRRRFMGVGPERKPARKFTLIKTADEEIVALVLDNEIQMIHEFSTGFTWPGPYTNVTEPQWQAAELLLQRLQTENPVIRCSRQDGYRSELDRRRRQEGQPPDSSEPPVGSDSTGESSPPAH